MKTYYKCYYESDFENDIGFDIFCFVGKKGKFYSREEKKWKNTERSKDTLAQVFKKVIPIKVEEVIKIIGKSK